ncbi:hypothetical protein Desti_3252 [Desulfomonile tiedjei DSM 6799]|uniref:Uncharacterized protein n=1 Tax=Desulfomonile tiedjei (strain ATCC 49306 / DSM 6799 / DCB-1) TaxID=706587 RepID=I4C8M0_DESTA|nr:hypothetical protein Desti_3252 [Desulfomonile tiedjei DSM 6799]
MLSFFNCYYTDLSMPIFLSSLNLTKTMQNLREFFMTLPPLLLPFPQVSIQTSVAFQLLKSLTKVLSQKEYWETCYLPVPANLLRYERHALAWLTSLRRHAGTGFARRYFFERSFVSPFPSESFPHGEHLQSDASTRSSRWIAFRTGMRPTGGRVKVSRTLRLSENNHSVRHGRGFFSPEGATQQ